MKPVLPTGLLTWSSQPEMVIMSANTTMDGKFMFTDLSAGEYVVSEVLKMGWTLVSPADGKFSENITDMSVTGLVFANQAMPVAAGNETMMPVEAENATDNPIEAENVTLCQANDTALIDATVAYGRP